MDLILIILVFSALLIGFNIGLLGGGGSILAVPVFVYLQQIDPHTATSYSLFVVGICSILATLQNLNKGLIHYKVGLVFAIPVFIVIFSVRKFLIPILPQVLYKNASFTLDLSTALMVLFSVVMLATSISMIIGRKEKPITPENERKYRKKYVLLILQGMIVGLITGLVGAGGGFLIIPALAMLARLPMKNAIATSLLIISFNSLIGFTGDIGTVDIDWSFLFLFSCISLIGVGIGLFINKKIANTQLRKIFGYFVLVMGVLILVKEILLG